PAGTTITSGAGSTSITVNFPNPYTGAPSVCVSAISACGTSAARCKTVGTNLPGQPGSVAGPTTNICNSTVQYSISNVAGATTYTWTNPAGTTITAGQGSTSILLQVSSAFTSGFLTVIANTNLCTPGSGQPRTITIYGKPNTPGTISAFPGTWCNGGFVTFSITAVTPLPNYNWFVPNGTITAGQGTNNIDVTWGTGTGNVNVTAGNGCGGSGTKSQSFAGIVCREEEDQSAGGSMQWAAFPNPAHDKITVSIDVKENSVFNIKLTDISGRILLSESPEGKEGINTYELDLSHFSKGVYLLKVSSAEMNKNIKVVIE
ncbi:MAG: T9SS type A sorting domain-containing protein, partial [Bacteroidota bacterium]